MIVAVNYSDNLFRDAQRLNSKSAYKNGADKVFSYKKEDLDEDFLEKVGKIFDIKVGGGFFVWKPYVIKKTLESISDGDYLMYSDSGSAYVDDIHKLIDCMESNNDEIMLFSLENELLDKYYCKRDVFVEMGCDREEYYNTPQILGTNLLLKKSDKSIRFVDEWLEWAVKPVITDRSIENKCGLPNYDGFVANRTQAVISLMAKRDGLNIYRDPSQYGEYNEYPQDVTERSTYGQIVEVHRNPQIKYMIELNANSKLIYYPIKLLLSLKRKIYNLLTKGVFVDNLRGVTY